MKQSKNIKLSLLTATFLSAVFSLSLITTATLSADETVKSPELKVIMQVLLADTKQITEGIFIEDFEMIKKAANNIATHPEAPAETKMKLMKAFGKEMKMFKGNDMKVHQAAVEIAKAAETKDIEAIMSQFHQLVDGCQSCHSKFKKRAQDILK